MTTAKTLEDIRASVTVERGVDKQHDNKAFLASREIDTAATVVYGDKGELDPAEALRICRKIDLHILPLMCILYLIQFMDKSTLGSASILGIIQSARLTTNQYNWLSTIFYLSYLAFEFFQSLALQRFPVAKWMSLNIFVWAVALCCHAACNNFGGLFAVRFILGMCEGSITAGFMIVSSMFYTRTEQTVRVGYWFLMNGTAQIISGFVSFGTLHIETGTFRPWQWLMVITGGLTLITAGLFWLFFPDTPTNAWFLTPQERVVAVMRLQANQTGVENKHFKKAQMIEALTDPKTWLFAVFSGLANVPNSLTAQGAIIVSSFGFTALQTTLLGCVAGVVEMVSIWSGVVLSARTGSRAWVSFFYFIPNVLGAILVNTLPWSNKVGLLFSVWLSGTGITAFVISLSWISVVTAGHTKRVTTNAIVLGAYCLGNAGGPFMWKAQYKPRDRIPWIVIAVCYVCCMALLLVIRHLLKSENKRRDTEALGDDRYNDVFVERMALDGSGFEKVKIDKEFLDLTDIQNREFRYVY
ncbi:major facilitator superfamily domain-containing protein [Mycena polygramma]|nr:major facilitator superfamily domain-containing protein [Mycena polygramma]